MSTSPFVTAERYHDFSAGHRVAGHESKCAHLHGHNYRVHFMCTGELDQVGRVLDFSAIKERLCIWLEDNWDHKFLCWDQDPVMNDLTYWVEIKAKQMQHNQEVAEQWTKSWHSFIRVPFNPTAENMAEYLLKTVGPKQLEGTKVRLVKVSVEETRKCSATAWGV